MGSSYRVSIYSQDSLGLGHLRRNILIGGAFLKATKDSNVLLFADSPVAPFFTLPERMDHIKLPSIRKVSAGCWEATRLRIDEGELVELRANLLRDALVNFRPDLLLVDHMPGGARGENSCRRSKFSSRCTPKAAWFSGCGTSWMPLK